MADVSVSGLERDGERLRILGTGFTKTTTFVYVDGQQVPFELVSDGEVTIEMPMADDAEIQVEKGEVASDTFHLSDAGTGDAEAAPEGDASGEDTSGGHTPNLSTTAEGEDDLADVTPAEMIPAANTGATGATPSDPPQPSVEPEVRGEHVSDATFRQAVHQSPVTRIEEDLGIGPRDPYPVGNPPDPKELYHQIHGSYPKEE